MERKIAMRKWRDVNRGAPEGVPTGRTVHEFAQRVESMTVAACDRRHAAEIAALRKNAERYGWLRAQHWNDGLMCVVEDPKKAVKLGPSLDRLDEQIDAAMLAQRAVGAA